MIWVTNESDRTVIIQLSGEHPLGGSAIPDLSAVTFGAEPGIVDAQMPFVDLEVTADGRQVPARVTVMTGDCDPIAAFDIGVGDYRLHVAGDGAVTLERYRFGQRPTAQHSLEPSTRCVPDG
jgi:proline racemase